MSAIVLVGVVGMELEKEGGEEPGCGAELTGCGHRLVPVINVLVKDLGPEA